ncbi:MAG: LacI family DNA-binding transcriptional regulator [Chloroflexi bacterium]|nr:LacI family DNA-binding transcriptional regulator [Chloroflexota bacterium]
MKPNLEAIAEKAGVSTATVSRALNDRSGVNAETRERILLIAREIGYMPNAAAKGLATSRTNTLGLIIYDRPPQEPITNFPDETILGVDQEARERGYHVITTFVNSNMMQDALRVPLVNEGRTDGLILVGPALKASFIIQLSNSDIPIVLVDNLLNESTIDAIVCDNVGGMYGITRHLLQTHDLRNLVFISGPADWFSSRERRQGYEKALAEFGQTPRVVYIEDTTMYFGYGAMLDALARFPELDGIVAVNDATAMGAIRACKERGIRVPEDIAVVGFDNVGWAPMHDPPLTTVRIFWREIGIQAARRLIDRIERDTAANFQIRMGTELMTRQSCGCSPDDRDGLTLRG